MSLRLHKPWIELSSVVTDDLPAQLGVFQLGDPAGDVIYIGYGGGNETFGLRTAIEREVARIGPDATRVRWELTHGYLSRWEELMMVHRFDHDRPPAASHADAIPTGRLSPGGS